MEGRREERKGSGGEEKGRKGSGRKEGCVVVNCHYNVYVLLVRRTVLLCTVTIMCMCCYSQEDCVVVHCHYNVYVRLQSGGLCFVHCHYNVYVL